MTVEKNKEKEFTKLLHRIINLAVDKETVPRRQIKPGVYLYRIEIHVIDAIGSHPAINLSGLANILGVTKGAMSQKIKILEKKGFISRYKNQDNNKEIYFELTETGRKIFEGHKKFHKEFSKKIFSSVDSLSETEINKFIAILKNIENHLETV